MQIPVGILMKQHEHEGRGFEFQCSQRIFPHKTFVKENLHDHFVAGLINYSLMSLICLISLVGINARFTPISVKDL